MLGVQSVRFRKSKFTLHEAKKIAKDMGFKVSVSPNPQYLNWRAFRQIQPNKFKPNSFRVKIVNKDIHLIVGDLISK